MSEWMPASAVIGDGPSLAFVLHGVLGSGRNWRSFARQLAGVAPAWRFALVDLRCHGDSHGAPPPHTVAACADDLARLATSLGQPPAAVLGHSFGGKVALAYAARHGVDLDQVWVLDAVPGPLAGDPTDHEVARVIRAVRSIPLPIARREDVVARLLAAGFSDSLAGWMSTNLARGAGGLVWRFDLDGVVALLHDYAALDLWPVLEAPSASPELHLVRAARSDRWTPDVLARLAALPANVRVHVLADAGHWVHADNPDGLLATLAPWL